MDKRKRLDIIINHYNEPFALGKPQFDMLANQKCVNWELVRVTVVNDGTLGLPELKEYDFPFELREIYIPHSGISASRNKGIEVSDAEWITFCDFDDCYADVYSLCMLMQGLNNNQFDLMWNKFYMTRNIDIDIPPDIRKELDWVWMANKYYRLDFLKEKGIKFNEELAYAEDSAFNNWVRFEIGEGKVGEIVTPGPLYAWCRRRGSTTTADENQIRNIQHVLKRNIYVSQMYVDYGRQAAPLMMARTITDGYSGAMRKVMNTHPEEKEQFVNDVRKFYRTYKEYIDLVPEDGWKYVLNASMDGDTGGGDYIPDRPSFDEWYETVIKENEAWMKVQDLV